MVLAQKLAEELQYEETALDNAKKEPEFLTSFKQSGIWNIDDTPGNDEVVLTRSFGNETVRLIFSIQDIQSQEQEPEFEEDAAEEQADDPIQSYGVRVAVSITKVLRFEIASDQFCVANMTVLGQCPRRHEC